MSTIEINAQSRSDLGKGASRRLRRTGNVPAIIYGAGNDAQAINIEHKSLWKAQEDERFYSSVMKLNLDGKPCDVVIKDLQRHPAKNIIMHADFQRVDDNSSITVNVPLHFRNAEACPGIKLQGGTLRVVNKLIKVRCTPSKLPTHLDIDLKSLNAGDQLHISDIQLPEGVIAADLLLGEDHNHPVVKISSPRGGKK